MKAIPVSPPAGIEWMLQSAQVDDFTLASTLVDACYPALYDFAFRLTGSALQASETAVWVAARTVRLRHRISIESSLRVWLFGQVYQEQINGRKRGLNAANRLVKMLSLRRKKPPETTGLKTDLPDDKILLALSYGHEFSLAETASILAVTPEAALKAIHSARLTAYASHFPESAFDAEHLRSLSLLHQPDHRFDLEDITGLQDHLKECSVCQVYALRLPELEARLSAEYYSSQPFDREAARQAVFEKAGINNHGLRGKLPWKELALVTALLVSLVSIGRSQDIFTPFDARPTITPQPTPPLIPIHNTSLVLPGLRNKEYFYFAYNMSWDDTLETVAEKFGLTLDQIRSLNPDPTGRSPSGGQLSLVAFHDSELFDLPSPRVTRDLPPLTVSSTPEEILDRMKRSSQTWQTLWSDAVFIYNDWWRYTLYRPFYIGPPLEYNRFQIWAAGPDRYVAALAHEAKDGQIYAHIFSDQLRFEKYGVRFHAFRDPSPGSTFPQSDFITYTKPEDDHFWQNSNSQTIEVIGTSQIAGRETLSFDMIDYLPKLRYWVDVNTGVPLRLQYLIQNDIVTKEFRINSIHYDVELPSDLFYPPSTPGLSWNDQGEPLSSNPQALPIDWASFARRQAINKRVTPPDGLDLASARLTFQRLGTLQDDIDVFVGSYYFGTMRLPGRVIDSCRRSPNGALAAYTASQNNVNGELHLLQLKPFSPNKFLDLVSLYHDYAFSPDGSALAYLNCSALNQCVLKVLDLTSGWTRSIPVDTLFSTTINVSLTWSPDGKQIALLMSENTSPINLIIVDLTSMNILYQGHYDLLRGEFSSPGSPIAEWGIPFPPAENASDC
jgi:DNA-directed RNA polymerase specialized sigma24 family protein